MPALFSRLKNWVAETLTFADLNAEIDNILNNFEPDQMDDHSVNLAEMQTQTDPGEQGTESLATSLAGEIERIRFALKGITGKTYWYETPDSTIGSIFTSLGSTQPKTRITSGKVRTDSNQGIWLVPDGAANTVTLEGATTNFVYVVNDSEYTISTDTALTGLTTAPSTNNTALVNDAAIADGEETKYIGEYGSELTIDTAGTEIVGEVGNYAGFKINDGSTDEYFIAYVESSTKLTQVSRGSFFDSADAPIPRLAVANNDTITLMRAAWVFAKTDLTLTFTTNAPRYGKDEPSGPVSNDYWFDTVNEIWKRYNGVAFVDAEAAFVGVALTDSANCVAALSADIFKNSEDTNSIELEVESVTEVRSLPPGGKVDVFGALVDFRQDIFRWSMTTDLESGVSEAADTTFFMYVTEQGETKISDKAPRDLRGARCGMYHPHHTWRCVGQAYNDDSSNLINVLSYSDESEENYTLSSKVNASALTVYMHKPPHIPFNFSDGTSASALIGSSIVVSSGSTLGTSDATDELILPHVINHDQRCEMAISFNQHSSMATVTTVAEGGAGAADTTYELYSDQARTDVYTKAIAVIESNQTTAGTWASAVDAINADQDEINKENIAVVTATGSFTVRGGVNQHRFQYCGGGGGGGGGGPGASGGGGGGGAGAAIIELVRQVEPGDSLSITIGAGGNGGAGGAGGVDGGATTITGTGIDLYAPGAESGNPGAAGSAGTGGVNYAAGVNFSGADSGAGGDGNTAAGSPGKNGYITALIGTPSTGGNSGGGLGGGGGGGGSAFGAGSNGAAGVSSGANGAAAATNPGSGGGGGGGAFSGGSSGGGGAGADGQVIMYWTV